MFGGAQNNTDYATTWALAGADWTAKAAPAGLAPGRTYHYRFRAGDAVSPTGRAKTLPDGPLAEARFAVVSCSNYPFGHFNVYDQIARRDDLDAVLHLGDYIYEYGPDGYGGESGARLGRPHDPPHEIVSLADYRRRHAQYKADPASRAMHAAHCLIAIWDDHETADNSWAEGANNHDPATEGEWAARKRAALQAYYEWMPIRDPEPGRLRESIFRSFSFGDLLTLAALETRLLARGAQLNFNDFGPSLRTPQDVAAFKRDVLWDRGRNMLGDEQLAYLEGVFRASVAKGQPWRLLANQIIMAQVTAPDLSPHVDEAGIQELEKSWDQARAFVEASKLGLPTNLDAWDGYPAARERFYEVAARTGAKEGLIVVTGDTHTWWANDLRRQDGTPMGVELGVHSVTSPSPYRKAFLGGKGAEYALLTNQENKAVRYLSGEDHGYIDLKIARDRAEAKFLAVDTVDERRAPDRVRAGSTVQVETLGKQLHVGEDPVQLGEAVVHRLLERLALAHLLGQVDGDDLGVAVGLEAVPGPGKAPAPVVEVGELAVVDDRDVGVGVRPVRVRAGDVDLGLGRHPHVTDRVRARELLEAVLLVHGLGIAEVLDDLERAAEREHLGLGDVLHEVGEPLEIAVELERDAEGVRRLLLGLVDASTERDESRLDFGAMPPQPVLEVEVTRRVRVGELVAHDEVPVLGAPVQRVARRVRPAVLHRLEHPRHLVADGVLRAVPVDDPGDPAHSVPSSCRYGRTSRYSVTSQSVTVAQYLSHSSRL